MRVKGENEKLVLNLALKKKIMASGSIISWQIEEEREETVLGSKITVDGD